MLPYFFLLDGYFLFLEMLKKSLYISIFADYHILIMWLVPIHTLLPFGFLSATFRLRFDFLIVTFLFHNAFPFVALGFSD